MSSLAFALFLATASAGPATPVAKLPDSVLDTVKCVREPITGSIAKTQKVCHTLREWQAIRDRAQQEASRFFQPGWTNGNAPEDKVVIEGTGAP